MTNDDRRHARMATRAIIDIGSNTVRLVVYGGPPRAADVLHNEKVTARLGKSVGENGLLSGRGRAAALAALARYHALLGLMGVARVDVVATAAVRDARNGAEFLDAVRAIGFSPRLLSGEEEAVTSAHGVLGAFPGAKGIVGDLGGGSLELVDIDGATCRHGVSMPLGTLRLAALRADGGPAFARSIGRALQKADWKGEPGSTLYLVGGSLRAFARYAMARLEWPIDDPHGFELDADRAERIAKALARRKIETLPPLAGIGNARMASLPNTAALLAVLIRRLEPQRLVFSAWGLREGILFEDLAPGLRRQDPLLAGVSAFVQQHGTSVQTATIVAGWTLAGTIGPATARNEQLRLAATMLCLAAVTVEPNLRTDLAREWALRKRWIGASTSERVLLAIAMLANTGRLEVPPDLAALVPATSLREAQAWGLATRLCRRFSGPTAQGIGESRLSSDAGMLTLLVEPPLRALVNDGAERDLRALANHLGLKAEVRVAVPPARLTFAAN